MEKDIKLSEPCQQFGINARHWESDLEFYKVETAFFRRLLDEYFDRLTAPQYIDKLKDIEHKLISLEEERHQTDKLLSQQLSQVDFVAKGLVVENDPELIAKQVRLEQLMGELKCKSQQAKKELFIVVEELLADDELYEG